jgi:GNAT superfamily N-acetyltransferase
MKLWMHTLKEILGDKEPHPDTEIPVAPPRQFSLNTVVPITVDPRYATALAGGFRSFANQLLLEWRDGAWHIIGEFIEDTMKIDPDARGKGLAEELFLRCIEHRNDFPVSNFTNKGQSAVRRAHRLAVTNAVRVGLPVPQEVLADYPDLQPAAQPEGNV